MAKKPTFYLVFAGALYYPLAYCEDFRCWHYTLSKAIAAAKKETEEFGWACVARVSEDGLEVMFKVSGKWEDREKP